MRYYVVRHGRFLDTTNQRAYDDLDQAIYYADKRKSETGYDYNVLTTDLAWTTRPKKEIA